MRIEHFYFVGFTKFNLLRGSSILFYVSNIKKKFHFDKKNKLSQVSRAGELVLCSEVRKMISFSNLIKLNYYKSF